MITSESKLLHEIRNEVQCLMLHATMARQELRRGDNVESLTTIECLCNQLQNLGELVHDAQLESTAAIATLSLDSLVSHAAVEQSNV